MIQYTVTHMTHCQEPASGPAYCRMCSRFLFLVAVCLVNNLSTANGQTTVPYTSSGTYSFTVPAGVTSVTVQCWGAGGAGGGVKSNGHYEGAGGAGGAFASKVISVTAGSTYTVQVGKGGTGGTGNGPSGGDSWFGSTSTVLAKGGAGGGADNGTAGLGTTTGSIGSTVYKGGDGAAGYYSSGSYGSGAGGGAAGTTGNGGSVSSFSPWRGGTGTSSGGGNGAGGLVSDGNGSNGSAAGGGGSGAMTSNNSNYSGGNGADGEVAITYTVPAPAISSFSPVSACAGAGTTVTLTGTSFSGATSVQFNGVNAASFTVVNSTTLTAVLPSGASTGLLSVTTPYGTGSSASNFTVNALPVISGTFNVCSGATIMLSGSGTPSGTNPWISGTTTVATVNNSGVVTGVAAGTSNITYTNSNGCSTSQTFTVNSSPVTTGVSICQGGSGSLTVSSSCSSTGPYASGPNESGTGATSGGSGTSWTNPSRVTGKDGSYAYAAMGAYGSSQYLYATNYGFSIPSYAVINGVQVTVGKYASGDKVQDNTVKLLVGGSISGNNNGNTHTDWPNSGGTTSYGSSTDLWGLALTPSDVNASNFGVALSVDNNRNSSRTAYVDYIEITISYTIPGTINWYTASSGGSSIATGASFNPVGVTGSGLSGTNSAGTTTYYAECRTVPGCRSAASFVVNATPALAQLPTSGLVGYYQFAGGANDTYGNDNGTLQNAPTAASDRFGVSNAAYSFNGSNQYVSTSNSYSNPTDFTISIWFRTSTASGGKLIGFGDAQTGASASYDRHLYMNNAGQIYFGVYPGSVVTIHSTSSYNDNTWHLATATLSSVSGMCLYIDGSLVASNGTNKTAQNYTGYWTIGYGKTSGWTSQPSSDYFNGTLDDALIYSTALTAAQVGILYQSPDGAGNNGPVCSGSTLTLSSTTLSGVTYAWTGPNSFAASSQNPTVTYQTTDAGTYKLIATGSGGCTATAYTTVVSSTTAGQWTGGFSPNWNYANNWCNGSVPTISTDVTVPSPSTNMPVVSDNEYCNNLVINGGATLTVNSSGSLKVAASITNAGVFDVTAGSLEMAGNSAQTIDGTQFYNKTINKLIDSNTGSGLSIAATANDTLKIAGALTFGNSGSTLSTGNNLELLSTQSGTACLGKVNTGNTITGLVIVDRYINTGTASGEHAKSWQLLTAPTVGETIRQSWMENGNSTSGYGIWLTGPGGTSSGFDAYSPGVAIKTYNAATNNWDAVTTTSSAVNNSRGYMLFIRGDRTVNGTTVTTATPTILRSMGTLLTGTQPAVNVSPGAYQSVGNPYPCPVDFTKMTRSDGVDNLFYVWDPYLSGAYGYGGYQTLSAANGWVPVPGGTSAYPTGVACSTIQSGQAFLVHATVNGSFVSQTPTLTISENSKSAGTASVNFARSAPKVSSVERQYLRTDLYVSPNPGAAVADGNAEVFDPAFSNKVDDNDALKIKNSGENFGLERTGTLLAIEARSPVSPADTVYYNMSHMRQQTYRLRIVPVNMQSDSVQAFLQDRYLGTSTPLSLTDTNFVDFSVTSTAASYAADRFSIVFRQAGVLAVDLTSLKARAQNDQVLINWTTQNESGVLQYEVQKSTDGNLFQTVSATTPRNSVTAAYEWVDATPAGGVNFYRIRTVNKDGKENYSNVVKVNFGRMIPLIVVAPNPIVDGRIQLQFLNEPAGNYRISLKNELGQVILQRTINHATGRTFEVLDGFHLSKGVYHLALVKPDGSREVLGVLY